MAVLDTDEIASVGTLVGAALETAGHFMQSAFIDLFETGYGAALGGYLYAFSILVAVTIIAQGGQYKFSRWFIIGPALFYAAVFPRQESCGVVVRFGERVYDPKYIYDATEGMASEEQCTNNPARVSVVFKLWDNFTSVTINSFVTLLRLDKRGADFDFVKKVDRFSALISQRISDPDIKEFLNLVIINNCGHVYSNLMGQLNPSLTDSHRAILNTEYEQIRNQLTVNLAEHPGQQEVYDRMKTAEHDEDSDGLLSCAELWGAGIDMLKSHAVEKLSIIADTVDLPEDVDPNLKKTEEGRVYAKLRTKFSLQYDSNTNSLEFLDEEQALLRVINEFAVRNFIREISEFNPALRSDVLDQIQVHTLGGEVGGQEEVSRALRSYMAREEYRGKGDFLKMMLGLPYLQGIALYFLAITYPFFAMMLVMPGRHTTFLLWFSLWLWIKSWDFGFAVVMLIDELLYALMPHGAFLSNEDVTNPYEAMKSVLELDPFYSTFTYYNLLASCLAAVPILSGAIVKKGGGAIMDGIANSSSKFSGDIGGSLSAYIGSRKAQGNLASIRRQQHNAALNAMYDKLVNDPEITMPLARAALLEAGIGVTKDQIPGIFKGWANRAQSQGKLQWASNLRRAANIVDPKNNFVAAGMEAYIRAEIDQDKRIAWSKHALEIQKIAFKTSTNRYNEELVRDARMNGFYSHNLFSALPAMADFNLWQNKLYLQWGNAVSASGNSINDFFTFKR